MNGLKRCCANCEYPDAIVFDSKSPKYKCSLTGELHSAFDVCNVPDGGKTMNIRDELNEIKAWCEELEKALDLESRANWTTDRLPPDGERVLVTAVNIENGNTDVTVKCQYGGDWKPMNPYWKVAAWMKLPKAWEP